MVKFAEVANQNPWWKHGKDFHIFDPNLLTFQNKRIRIERKQLDLRIGDIGVIRGCRQIGKTTYMKLLVKKFIEEGIEPRKILYLSADRLVSRGELRNAVDDFLRRTRDADEVYILLDEITTIREWNLELKRLSDSGITQRARVLVTGSSGAALRGMGEQLPGRGLEGNEYYMRPLNFGEFIFQTIKKFENRAESGELSHALEALETALKETRLTLTENFDEIVYRIDRILPFKNELEYLFEHYLRCGGFPIAINPYFDNTMIKRNEDFFDPDVVEVFVRTVLGELSRHGKSEATARQILRAIIDRYGTRFSFNNLANDLTITHVTTGDYLDFLESSFILSTLYAYNFNKKDLKHKGSKKVYFQDPFIFYSMKSAFTGAMITDVIRETLENEVLVSEIIEGIVSSHLTMSMEIPYLKEKNTFLWFYYDTRGKEIDNVLMQNGEYLGIEVKYQNNVSPRDVTRVQEIDNYLILSKHDVDKTDDTYVVPVEAFLSLLEMSKHNL
jgi:predicted AAA+ superfamily ATPase